MQYIFAPFVLLYKLWFGLMFFGQLLLLWPVLKIVLSREKWYPIAFKINQGWSRVLQVTLFVPLIKKLEAPFPKSPYIVCANHTSYLDIVLMYSVIPDYFLFIGKHELLKWPLLRVFFLKWNITVNRQNRIEAVKSIVRASHEMDQGTSIAIFPEGTMPPANEAPQMVGFKNGAFKLAIKKQVPIVPVTFLNNYKLFSDHTMPFRKGRPGISRVIVHEAIETKGMTDQDLVPLKKRVREVIEKALTDYENR